MDKMIENRGAVNKWMERFGVRFGVYKNGVFKEQLFPFDAIPRVISKEDWDYLERGLIQRVDALNLFLNDIYHEKEIIKDGIIPAEFIYSSKGYLPECEGHPRHLFAHIGYRPGAGKRQPLVCAGGQSPYSFRRILSDDSPYHHAESIATHFSGKCGGRQP